MTHPDVVIGVGVRREVPAEVVRAAVSEVLAAEGIWVRNVSAVVTAEGKVGEPGIREVAALLGVPVRGFGPEALGRQPVPNPSEVVREAVGTPSVAEAAVLAAGARLTRAKLVIGPVTVALGQVVPEADAQGARRPDGARGAEGGVDLGHHGDLELGPGLVDLAVNVRQAAPAWLADRLRAAVARLAPYPDPREATAAVAARHGRPETDVLLTAGAAEAFVLLARALNPARAVVVHPQFTEPEAALRAAGHPVERVILEPPFTMTPAMIPDDADLVVIGNPTNPTSVLHPAATIRQLIRPGRVVLVDEAFMDAVPGEQESLAAERLDGLVVTRSLTKTWGLAGLRIGYLLGPPDIIERCREVQPLWSVGTLALEAAIACSSEDAIAEAEQLARDGEKHREILLAELGEMAGIDDIEIVGGPRAPFLLIRTREHVHQALRERGWAVRRADTFPGLGPGWIRVAVRDPETSTAFAEVLATELARAPVRTA